MSAEKSALPSHTGITHKKVILNCSYFSQYAFTAYCFGISFLFIWA